MRKRLVICAILALLLALAVLILCLAGRTEPGSEETVQGVVIDRAMGKVREEDSRARAYLTLELEDGTAQLYWFSRRLQRREVDAPLGDTVRIETAVETATGLRVVTQIVNISSKEG